VPSLTSFGCETGPGPAELRILGRKLRVEAHNFHPWVLTRTLCTRVLLTEGGFEVIARCASADELHRELAVALSDVTIPRHPAPADPHRRGLRAAIDIRARYPSVAVLVLSQYLELGLAMKLLATRRRAPGACSRTRISDVPEFLSAVRRVARGVRPSIR
jgi:DNA-binding NarL/FixJ family response regulator